MSTTGEIVSDVGEFGLIDKIKKILPDIEHPDIKIGIGDDTAVIKIDDNKNLLITCDIQIENQHFNLDYISAYKLGRRAMAVNLSDIAAMGGKPTFALISLGLPVSYKVEDLELLYMGMNDQLSEFSAFIIGGNLSKSSDKLIIDVTMMGEAEPDKILTRDGAKAGDRIFITNGVGLSGAGLQILKKYQSNFPDHFKKNVSANLCPIPRIEIGQNIADSGIATAMIDISDGLVSDLFHICEMSKVGAELYEKNIPKPSNYKQIEAIANKPFIDLALNGGEDYELLFTIKASISVDIITEFVKQFEIEIIEIGKVVKKEYGLNLINIAGKVSQLKPKGWDHFQK